MALLLLCLSLSPFLLLLALQTILPPARWALSLHLFQLPFLVLDFTDQVLNLGQVLTQL